jgi:single-stranded DNA-binding protein
MLGVNSVFLLGTVYKGPEQLATEQGKAFCRFILDCRTGDSSEERSTRLYRNLVEITCFGHNSAFALKLGIGEVVCVTGRIQSLNVACEEGGKRRSLAIVASQLNFLKPGPEEGA